MYGSGHFCSNPTENQLYELLYVSSLRKKPAPYMCDRQARLMCCYWPNVEEATAKIDFFVNFEHKFKSDY